MNNKTLGIAGSAILIIGIFLPIVNLGPIGVSAFNALSYAPINQSWPVILILLCGIIGLILALTNRFRLLLVPGIISLGLLVFGLIKMKSDLSGASDAATDEFSQQMAASVSIGFGMYVMIIGAVIMIVAGVMKSAVPMAGPGYGAPPPYPPR